MKLVDFGIFDIRWNYDVEILVLPYPIINRKGDFRRNDQSIMIQIVSFCPFKSPIILKVFELSNCCFREKLENMKSQVTFRLSHFPNVFFTQDFKFRDIKVLKNIDKTFISRCKCTCIFFQSYSYSIYGISYI